MVLEMSQTGLPYFVAIGASGSEGLADLKDLLGALPRIPAVVMVVLHRPSDEISRLREILSHDCNMPIIVATEAETLVGGTCYIG